mgnify:CR=1 FL=1
MRPFSTGPGTAVYHFGLAVHGVNLVFNTTNSCWLELIEGT